MRFVAGQGRALGLASLGLADDDLVFNPRGLRHYRKTYSRGEWRASIVVLLGLGMLLGWVQWKGAHPDPALFANGADLLDPGQPPAERGPLPSGLALPGWRESGLARFDAENLYRKINGRADYFKVRGFVELAFLTLTNDAEPSAIVDVEFYDLAETQNSFGAYAGEKAEDAPAQQAEGALWHFERNALFLARDRYYVRAIGSDEGERVRQQLEHLRVRLLKTLAQGERPWAHALFGDALGLSVSAIGFDKENAFSFGFARDVYWANAATAAGDDTQWFVTQPAPDVPAAALAGQFLAGFAELGSQQTVQGQPWVKDQYLDTWATARVRAGRFVYGVRTAPDQATGQRALEQLERALDQYLLEPSAPIEERQPAPGAESEPMADTEEADR